VLATMLLACSADGPGRMAAKPPPPTSTVDYLVIAARSAEDELAPLVALREQQGHDVKFLALEDIAEPAERGRPSAPSVRRAIKSLAGAPGSKLKYVLLAGHPSASPALPTFARKQGEWSFGWGDQMFLSDHEYALFEEHGLAVGRLPVRSDTELAVVVEKIVRYETAPAGDWQRRVMVVGGPADFGPVADALIEWQATTLLDEVLPYDYDVNVLFAKADSPYAYRFDRLGQKIVSDLNQGALLAVYAGHGNEDSFDNVYFRGYSFPIGTAYDLAALDVVNGAPFFISLTCHTGAFGGDRISLGETLALHPRGPVAVFGSSEVSHPYPNFLYAETLLDSLLEKRLTTLGDAVVAAKKALPQKRIFAAEILDPDDHDAIKDEHLYLYNLLGDPATRLRYPARASVDLGPGAITAGGRIEGSASAPGLGDGDAVVTLETERTVLRGDLETIGRSESIPIERSFETMAKNHAIATDKIVSRKEVKMTAGRVPIELDAPPSAGRYVVKVLLNGAGGVASTHARVVVDAAPR